MKYFIVFLLEIVLFEEGWVRATELAGAEYDRKYPWYAEFCTLTQYKPKVGEPGGTGGHAVLYLKGVCRDENAAYPRLKMCEENIDLSNPDAGTGTSVDKAFRNVNWTAVPTKTLLLRGLVKEGQTLTQNLFNTTVQQGLNLGLFKGIKFREEYTGAKPDDMTEEQFVATHAVGTDFAIGYARNIYCTRLPMPREMISKAVDFLNGLNDKAWNGDDYEWSQLKNNCTHTTHNALAAAGVWQPLLTGYPYLVQVLGGLGFPIHEFNSLQTQSVDESLDVARVFRNPVQRETFLKHAWLPVQPGAVAELIGIHPENDLYFTDSDFGLDIPMLKPFTRSFRRILKKEKYLNLEANLAHVLKRYKQALVAIRPWDELAAVEWDLNNPDFREFHARFKRHLEEQVRVMEGKP